MNKIFNPKKLEWLNKPKDFEINEERIIITTEPKTDFWQRTYYGFRNDNAHSLLMETDENFSFIVKTDFEYKNLYDQCGVLIYQDSDNWFKASIEYENDKVSRLGSVVTNFGYSDWASCDINAKIKSMCYRLSRRDQDFLMENSMDGITFNQMRIFHLHKESKSVKFGIYACSPTNSSFKAFFSNFRISQCIWEEYK